jgi:hypothetical protein
MRERELRCVLLVKAIEESDPQGELIPIADRTRATREVQRASPAENPVAVTSLGTARLPEPAERLLVQRAERLRGQVALRFPVVDRLLEGARLPGWLAAVMMALSAVVGFTLSALDASQRVNILAFPLLGLIAWNVAVYASLLARPSLLPGVVIRGVDRQLLRLARKAAPYNTALANALGRFAADWSKAMAPLLAKRGAALFHVCAAVVGVGLIAGLYLRGIALRYDAGWESTFLGAQQARVLIGLLYGPASALTGVPLPDLARLEAIRWDAGRGGENAAPWIHLLAATTLLWIVLPRLLLALVYASKAWQRARDLTLGPDAVTYFRNVFAGAEDLVGRGVAAIVAYAYAPSTNALAALRNQLSGKFGGVVAGHDHVVVRHGEEDGFLQDFAARMQPATQVLVVLFSLATTPEEENHGTLLTGVRDWRVKSGSALPLLIAVDEAPYATQPRERVEERRELWRRFVAAHGLEALFLDLGPR